MRALIIGFFGAQPKHLRRYAEMYKTLGFTETRTFHYPILDATTWAGWSKLRTLEMGKYDVVHTLSGGCLVAFNMWMAQNSGRLEYVITAPLWVVLLCLSMSPNPSFILPPIHSLPRA